MRALVSFMKKEWLYQLRSSKLVSIGIIFVMLGMLSPAIAKLTPDLLELLTETQGSSSMTITVGEVTALDSWMQFFKNIPMGLIAFILIESSIFTKEYESGTLVLALTKGLDRYKVVLSKAVTMIFLWTVGYFVCFGITYVYSAYFWDNSIVENLMFSVVIWWLFGLLAISLSVLFSTLSKNNIGVLIGTGGVILASYFVGMFPKVDKLMPTMLMDGNSLVFGLKECGDYTTAIAITVAICIISLVVSIPVFNKKYI
ncbi:MAG: ABC transporter permease subunit [Clostridia bacterium]|nr:ABC transporter permease subunit [Clostridia bacterium]